jgi:DNA segregation ATPase FtsK/SpoIIIE-like protein
MNKHFKEENDADYIKRNARLLEMILEAFGVTARVAKTKVENGYMFFDLELAVGTRLSHVLSLNKDLALGMASPTDKVEVYPVIGTNYVEIKIPLGKTKLKEEKYKIIRIEVEAPKLDDWATIKIIFGTIFKKIGEAFYWVGNKITGRLG